MIEDDSERTPDEQRILEQMREKRGEKWVQGREELILKQAKLVGEL